MSPAQQPRTPLASVDVAWLHMDEPTNPMVITIAMFFDAPLDYQQLRTRVEERLLAFDRFRQRVVTWRGGTPHWEPDPRFALKAHLHRLGLPGAGGDEELRELLGDLISSPLDPTRPLWQLYLVDHYGAGCVVVVRIHHCLADGMALLQIFNEFLDQPISPAAPAAEALAAAPGPIDQAFEALGAAVRSTEQALQEGWGWISHPERALGLLGGGAAVLSKLALMGPDAPSILKGKLSGIKRAAWSEPSPLSEIKAVGRVLGGTVNDVILTAVSGALRRYMDARAAPISTRGLRAMVPVNLLPPGARADGGNHFGLVYVTLPVGTDDPVERMARLRREMDSIKASPEAYVAYGLLNVLGVVPVDIEHTLRDALSSMASMVFTNMPGPRAANALVGQPIGRAMFWVPESGNLGLGISILSYAGSVQVGIVTDVNIIPDPEALGVAVDEEFAELFALAHAVAEE
jgi:diacylglycerol O-acyltransferase / wax synthase